MSLSLTDRLRALIRFGAPKPEESAETLRARASALAENAVERTATQFADDAIRLRKFLPADRPYLERLFVGALLADGDGQVRFAEGGDLYESECCTALREMVAQRPAHELVGESIASRPAEFSQPGGVDERRMNELLMKTDLGRKACRLRSTPQRGEQGVR